jgi:hypothetical protein
MGDVNDKETRIVRVWATDLAVGDIVVTQQGDYVGTVDTQPVLYGIDGTDVQLFTGDGYTKRRYGISKSFHVEIPRRTR